MSNLNNLVEETIVKDLQTASTLEEGAVKDNIYKNIAMLYNAKNDAEKIALESSDKYEERLQNDEHHRIEMEMKNKELKETRIALFVNVGLSVVLFVGNTVAYSIWQDKGFLFEKGDTVANPWTKNLMNRMLPNKK